MTAGGIALREATFNDYEQIAAVQRRNGLRMKKHDYWLHLWQNNPAYQRRPRWPIGWVLENGQKQIVGSVNNIPLEYEFEGQRLTVSAGRGWAADPPYRGYSTLLMDEMFSQQGVDLFLNTTVNRHAAEAFRLFDCSPVPAGQWDQSGYWITNYRGFAESALANRGWGGAARVACYPAAVALYLQDRVAGRRRPKAGTAVNVDLGFDERFDAFWAELRRGHRLLALRSQGALEWHFRYGLEAGRVHILTVSRHNRLRAYAVFARKDNEEYGLKRMRLVDYQSLEDEREPLWAMLSRELEICRQQGVHILEDVGCSIDAAAAPRRRKLASWLYYYKVTDAVLGEKLKDPARWRPSLFDGDSSL